MLGHVALGGSGSPKAWSWAGSAGQRGLACKDTVIPCSENTGAARGRYWIWQLGVTGNGAANRAGRRSGRGGEQGPAPGKHLGFPGKETGKGRREEGARARGDAGGRAAAAGFLPQGGTRPPLVTGSTLSPEARKEAGSQRLTRQRDQLFVWQKQQFGDFQANLWDEGQRERWRVKGGGLQA